MSTVIITAANEPYAPLMRDLIASLAGHRTACKLAIAVLDLGLEPATREEIAREVEHVVSPKWMFKPHAKFDGDKKYLSRAARPFLPDLIPSYATYIWLDADVWVQQRLGLEWLIDAAKSVDLAAVPTLHRAYTFAPQDIAWLHERYAMALGTGLANELINQAYYNTGAFAARAGSRIWRAFAERFQTALNRWHGDFLSDQAVINATIAFDGLSVNRLPARANWLCHLAMPLWNEKMKILTEPALPFEPLLIVHNTFDAKQQEHPIKTLTGRLRHARLTRSSIQALAQSDSQ